MKKIGTYIMVAMLVASTPACSDFLEKEYDVSMSIDQVFGNSEHTRGILVDIYMSMPDVFQGFTDGQYRAASRDCMTDNAISFWDVHYYNSVLSGGYSAITYPETLQPWKTDVYGIRKANNFMKNARIEVVGNTEKAGDDNHLYNRYMAEARLMRAIFHFDLVANYGAVPLIGDDENGEPIVFDLGSPEAMNMKRTSAAEVLKWVADECDEVKNVLPFRYQSEAENWGRCNGASAYALKSRALLYRASKLNNPDNNLEWWKEAAQASLDFIAMNDQSSKPYGLYKTEDDDKSENYYECFASNPTVNNEYILTRSVWSTTAIEQFSAPCGFTGSVNGEGRTNPTQNFVDCYEMTNGKRIDEPGSGYDPQNPYKDRDPRLAQTVFYHGMTWGDKTAGEERALDMTYGSANTDYQSQFGGTLTGYYMKKFVYNISFKTPAAPAHACPIFRYGEILLNAAEALNEAYGPDGIDGKTAYRYVNEIRERVGMPAYSGMSQDELRKRIRNERRIELAFEDHRFFDERRWMLFEDNVPSVSGDVTSYSTEYCKLYGVRITTENGKTKYTYGPAEKRTQRVFVSPKNYLLPIPQDEVKRAPNLGQNPGWDLSSSGEE